MPFVVTQTVVLQETIVNALLAAFNARPAGALLTTPTVELYTDDHSPHPRTDAVTDFTIAAFTGYAAQVITFGSSVNGGPNSRLIHGEVNYLCTADGIYPTIKGAILTDGATALYAQVQFDSPVVLVQAGDQLSLDLSLPLPFAQSAG